MQLSAGTKINDLLATHPFLEDYLVGYHPHFRLLKNKITRATVGRLATLGAAARIASVDLGGLLRDLASAIEKETAVRPDVAGTGDGALGREARIQMLGQIIAGLHDGGDVETARAKFQEAVGDVDAGEIATMEEELIRGGLPVGEVQRLCDVHVGAFRDALDEKRELAPPPGHAVHTYLADNRIIADLSNHLSDIAQQLGKRADLAAHLLPAAGQTLADYQGLDNHYLRKENQLFPLLERHGITGPSKVMWGLHDQIRARWKEVRRATEAGDAATFLEKAPALARDLVEMIYKEEKILFPMAMETLSEAEWAEEKRGEDELGYVFAKPALDGNLGRVSLPSRALAPADQGAVHEPPTSGLRQRAPLYSISPHAEVPAGLLELGTGALSLEVVDLMLRHLPIDISFVDENDVVRYYSDGKDRIFPRTPGAIGRQVQNCHPQKSVATVNRILGAFKAGEKDVAEFWIHMGGRFVHIRYFAVRDRAGRYRGCLEVTQDIGALRALAGERRLLDWEN